MGAAAAASLMLARWCGGAAAAAAVTMGCTLGARRARRGGRGGGWRRGLRSVGAAMPKSASVATDVCATASSATSAGSCAIVSARCRNCWSPSAENAAARLVSFPYGDTIARREPGRSSDSCVAPVPFSSIATSSSCVCACERVRLSKGTLCVRVCVKKERKGKEANTEATEDIAGRGSRGRFVRHDTVLPSCLCTCVWRCTDTTQMKSEKEKERKKRERWGVFVARREREREKGRHGESLTHRKIKEGKNEKRENHRGKKKQPKPQRKKKERQVAMLLLLPAGREREMRNAMCDVT